MWVTQGPSTLTVKMPKGKLCPSQVSKPERKRQISYDIAYMWNLILKNDTNELIQKTEIDPQTQKTNLWLPKGKAGEGKIRSLGLTYTHYYV